jgi:hypothetical protein
MEGTHLPMKAPRSPAHAVFARAVFGLDRRLQQSQGVFEYSSDPDCIFRVRFMKLPVPVTLSQSEEIPRETPVAELHLWNEQLPLTSEAGTSIAWGCAFSRRLGGSLRLLADYLRQRPEHRHIRGVIADMTIGTPKEVALLIRISGRYGFRPCLNGALGEPSSSFFRVAEDIYYSMIRLAQDPRGFRIASLRRSRVPVFLTREELERRFGRNKCRDTPCNQPAP